MTLLPSRATLFFSGILLSSVCLAEGEPAESVIKDSTKSAVSSFITAGKNLLGGVSEGVLDGRESVQGTDGAAIISSDEQMKDRINVEVLKLESSDENVTITLGFKNSTDTQLRLINLGQTGALLAIDQAGYANRLTGLDNADEVTVPPKTAVRQKFVFEGMNEAISSVRVWGKDYSVKK
ncbi:hypothetical protein HU742_015545 [Pseudomonas sp. SWRI102]|uniref:Uncharacterized protein n=1 Tax=Pseudomonas marvdashtae TaxID=2745500 RepID=A0A923FMS1_9PSED|nr:hypothetical protein [Pseudomonas marvdashtae]MBV4552558.1 hypothetical protein [Pseudomonas marvdashtae]